MRTLDVVLVNRNSGLLLEQCLESIHKSVLTDTLLRSVAVVDNASSDGSAKQLHCLLPITVYKEKSNKGFSAACNFAARRGCADYLLFINPDVVIYPYTLESSIDALSRNENAGALGIHFTDRGHKMQNSRMLFPKPHHFFVRSLGLNKLSPVHFPSYFSCDQSKSGMADCVLGAFLLVKRPAYEAVGGFDESFFLYFEEIDFVKRLKTVGYTCIYRADILAQHIGSCGEGANVPFRIEQSIRSRLYYAKRYFSPAGYRLLRLFTLSIEPLIRAAYALLQGDRPFAVIKAYRKAALAKQENSGNGLRSFGQGEAGAAE